MKRTGDTARADGHPVTALGEASVHPTAIVYPGAELASGVTVGPGAIIESGARIGSRTVIQAYAVIRANVIIGKDNTVGYGAILGGDPQDFSFRPEVASEVRIGDGNIIREYCTIHRGSSDGSATVLGHRCYVMGGAHLAHNVRLGDDVVIANNALLGGHVRVDDRVFIGGGCVFHQHVRIGRLAICQGASAFSKDIPPFTIAAERNGVAGVNVIGLRRAGIGPQRRAEIKEAFALLYRRGCNRTQALARARERQWGEEAQLFFDFVAGANRRGLCALIRKNGMAIAGADEA